MTWTWIGPQASEAVPAILERVTEDSAAANQHSSDASTLQLLDGANGDFKETVLNTSKWHPAYAFFEYVNVLWFATTYYSILEIIFLTGFFYKSVSSHMDKINWITKCSLSVTLVYEWMSSLVFQGSYYACPSCTIYIHSSMLKVFRIEHCPWIWDLKCWCTNYSWFVGCDCELLSRSGKLFSTFPTSWDLDSPIWVLEWRQCHVVT